MLRWMLPLLLSVVVLLGGCPVIGTSGGGSAVGTAQVRLEVQFIAIEDRFFDEIGVDFNQPLALAGGAEAVPQIPAIAGATDPLAFNGNTTGGILEADYLFPPGTTGGFLPASAGGQQSPAVLVYPGALLDFEQVLDQGRATNFTGVEDPGSLVIGERASDLASVFGRLLATADALELVTDLERDADATVITAPRVTLQSGQRSLLQVANEEALTSLSEFAFLRAIREVSNPAPFSTSIGPVLDVRPVVVGEQVELRIVWGTQVISVPQDNLTEIGGAPTQVFVPITQAGRVQTTIRVPNGGALLLGGFGQDNAQQRGLPLLNDLPVIGRTFQAEAAISDEETLLVLIRPRIVTN